jgi:UPF0755 protein
MKKESMPEPLKGIFFRKPITFPKRLHPGKSYPPWSGDSDPSSRMTGKKQAEKLGLSIHQVVTLASIIEKETGAVEERPIISSVFHNRLKKGMRLESDPTVIYGIRTLTENITRKHLTTPNPYNTYLMKGLPPDPLQARD